MITPHNARLASIGTLLFVSIFVIVVAIFKPDLICGEQQSTLCQYSIQFSGIVNLLSVLVCAAVAYRAFKGAIATRSRRVTLIASAFTMYSILHIPVALIWLAPSNFIQNTGIFTAMISALITSTLLVVAVYTPDARIKKSPLIGLAISTIASISLLAFCFLTEQQLPLVTTQYGYTPLAKMIFAIGGVMFALTTRWYYQLYSVQSKATTYWFTLAMGLFAVLNIFFIFNTEPLDTMTYVLRSCRLFASLALLQALRT